MKKIKLFFISFLLTFTLFNINVYASTSEMRAAWISTVYNLDWPSESSKGNVTNQKKEFIDILEKLKSIGINTVVVQVRPKGDALYKSSINPWSDVLTGTQGKNPGYDPLKFMINEAHKRGMEFHAWFNPYRVTTSGTNLNSLAGNHPARQNPDWIITYNRAMYYNPENANVKQHIVDTVKEVVSNYDVDGIHFDDYFYPEKYPLPEGEDKDGEVANLRREHVNEMVRSVRDAIKSIKPSVKFGISPGGIWKNKSSDITGSDTRGNESYYSVYADTRTWIKNKWIDYIVPQLYWQIGYVPADYQKLVEWWSNEVKGTGVDLYIGQGIYKEEVSQQIEQQIDLNRKYDTIKGHMYFTTNNIIQDPGLQQRIKLLNNVGWIYENDNWYYRDLNSKKVTGWLNLNDIWYYLDESGAMKTGWLNLNDIWYYLDESGAMKTGWLNLKNTWYYLDESGAMKTGKVKIENKYYYFDKNGVWIP